MGSSLDSTLERLLWVVFQTQAAWGTVSNLVVSYVELGVTLSDFQGPLSLAQWLEIVSKFSPL